MIPFTVYSMPYMPNKPFKPELRLNFQGSVKIINADEGDIIYEGLKTFFSLYRESLMLNGQIMKPLEPCCKEKKQ